MTALRGSRLLGGGSALIALVCGGASSGQQESSPRLEPSGNSWHWSDGSREPFRDWHREGELQRRLYDDAYRAVRDVVGIDLPQRIAVRIVPGATISHLGVEVGAKTGSLRHDLTIGVALSQLGLHTPLDELLGSAGIGPQLDTPHVLGAYVPWHPHLGASRSIFVRDDLESDRVSAVLRHELIHAMQDVSSMLAAWANNPDLTLDAYLARAAVEEGFALHFAEADEAPATTPGDDAAREALLACETWAARCAAFTYGGGARLIREVLDRASDPRELLLLLFERPPESTREVLRPDLYEAALDGDPGQPEVDDPAFAAASRRMAAAFDDINPSLICRTRSGQFFLFALLAELGLEPAAALDLSAHWQDDLLMCTIRVPDEELVVAAWRLDGEDAAAALEASIAEVLSREGLGPARARRPSSTDRAGAWFVPRDTYVPHVVLARDGSCVVYAAGKDLESFAADELGRP